MAASVKVRELNGTSPGTSSIADTARFCTADNNNPGTNYPLVKPDTGQTNRSFWKTFFLMTVCASR
jgi:hypothetical protein